MENLEMKWFLIVSDLLIPMIILGILCYGILRQVAVYDVFVKGAKSGFLSCKDVFFFGSNRFAIRYL